MDISFYLANYIQYRISSGAKNVDFYIADCMQAKHAEIILKDDGVKLDDDSRSELSQLSDFCTEMQGQHQLLFHRGENTLNLEWPIKKALAVQLTQLHSLLGLMMIEHSDVHMIFTYLSRRGDYMLDSSKFHELFDGDELMDKYLLVYMNEILEGHLKDVRDCL